MPSPAMIVALFALFFAMSGFGIAAKNMITGKQIKDGTITSKDLAKEAIKAKNLGPGSVTATSIDPDYLPPDSLRGTSSGLYPVKICPNGMILPQDTECFAIPTERDFRYAKAENVTDFSAVSVPGQTCAIAVPIPLSGISNYPDLRPSVGLDGSGDFFELSSQTTSSQDVRFTATARAEWEAGAGAFRGITIFKTFGSGPNEGERVSLANALDVPSADTGITQYASVDFAAKPFDKISFQAIQCGTEAVDLKRLDVSVVPQASQDPPATG